MSFYKIFLYICSIKEINTIKYFIMEILDVTKIEPRFKHSTIFQTYADLAEGESFVIHNDHDPKPLYYHFSAEMGDTFAWEYLLEGPEFWEVKISKLKAL